MIMCQAEFDYSYEYQGNAPKLVHTPLTDKCYLTLTQAMWMGYGGNPYGPAGTGKTETVKALGQAFGRQTLVFNCDEGLDYQSMGRIFQGLVLCGAWGCFDEFNRLKEDQLSAISQQIQIIQSAIKSGSDSVELLSASIQVNKNAGIFVTLNPAGKGYGGRSKLPDNLKQLFRPIAMSVPDNELIAEVLLYSEGFKHAKLLSKKIVSLFLLSRQLLSPQQHYDWGLRALKTILTISGQLITSSNLTEQEETTLLIQAIRVNTLSKLTYTDVTAFGGLVKDLFPNIPISDISYTSLEKAIHQAVEAFDLQIVDHQIKKILQFYENLKQRIGVVLVGPSGSGKTSIWKILKKAKEILGEGSVQTYVMNPKSMKREQLLGYMNNEIREFTDGVLTHSAREVIKREGECWIICDGDIDPEWIESLNSVLDDNHLLTLPSGERISFGSNVNFIFETSDLSFASPATVSRMGMIFLNQEDLPVQTVINGFLKEVGEHSGLQHWLPDFLPRCLEVSLQFGEVVKTTRLGLVKNVLSLVRNAQNVNEFAEGIIKGFITNVPLNDRPTLVKSLIDILDLPLPESPEFTVHKGKIQKIVPNYQPIAEFNDPLCPPIIQTVDLLFNLTIVNQWMAQNESIIIVGPEGSGKNMIFRSCVETLSQTIKTQIVTIHCNAQTQALQIIQKLNQVCLKATNAHGRILKPKNCGRLILYLKDINLPKPDLYQTIQLIAFLQQLITHKGYYDGLEFIQIDDKIQILCTMNPPSTIGRYELSSRFTANTKILVVDYPKPDSLVQIYSLYTKNSLPRLSEFLVELYQSINSHFSIDTYRHYLFTPKHITALIFRWGLYEERDLDSLYYECQRTFKDKIVDEAGKRQFDELLITLFGKFFDNRPQPAMYTSLITSKKLTAIKKEDYCGLMGQGLLAYSREYKEMSLVLLDETLDLLKALDRILSLPESNVFLAGRCGTSRRSAVSLMASMMKYELCTPSLTKDYSLKEFKKDLKTYFEIATVQNRPCVLLIEDYQITQPEFLEILNSLISSYEVSGLFTPDEIEALLNNSDVALSHPHLPLQTLFQGLLKKNLHIVVSLDHHAPNYNTYLAQNPALITKCHIVYLNLLSKNSLTQIFAQEAKFLQNRIDPVIFQNLGKLFEKINEHLQEHQKMDIWTYKCLQVFKSLFIEKDEQRKGGSGRLEKGLEKLEEANRLVAELQQDAEVKKKELEVKELEANGALESMSAKMALANSKKQEIEQKQKIIQSEEEKTMAQENEVKGKLENIQPLIDEALLQVGSISKGHLDELKSLRMPPEPCHDVLSAVLKLFGTTDNSWNSMKRFLGQKGFIEQVINYNAKDITPEIQRELQAFIQKRSSSFEKETIFKVSRAAGPLAMWVQAILGYSQVLIQISPLTSALSSLQQRLKETQLEIEACEGVLSKINEEVNVLKENFKSKTKEAEFLKQGIQKSEGTLKAAQNLVNKLSEEKGRWQGQIDDLTVQFKVLPIESLQTAAFIIYLSNASELERERWTLFWKQSNPKYNLLNFLAGESVLLGYKQQGLPGDQLSLQNSCLLWRHQAPLLIDPNVKATEWLQTHLNLQGILQSNEKFMNQLELSVRFGKPLIVKEVDGIWGCLINLLRGDFSVQGGRTMIKIGDKLVEYTEGFRLYLCTRDAGLRFRGVEQGWIGMVNFTVTKSGLEGKLLSIVINKEKPDIEERKSSLLQEEEDLKVRIAGLENNLLDQLANSKGNILENVELIHSLNETKAKSIEIKKSLQKSHALQQDLDQQRNVYRKLAQIGANLFIQLTDMAKVNHMYRFSLSKFTKIFEKSLIIGYTIDNIQQKLEYAQSSLYSNILEDLGTCLFKQDRLLFALHLSRGLDDPHLAYTPQIPPQEWAIFTQNYIPKQIKKNIPYPWLPEDHRPAFDLLCSALPALSPVFQEGYWEEWIKDYQSEKFVGGESLGLSGFQKVLIINALRPDRAASAIQKFVCDRLQVSSIYGKPKSLKNLYEQESNPTTPILFITTQGSDPSEELEDFAKQNKGSLKSLSMGGGQNDLAVSMLRDAAQKGHWLYLKNVHLVTKWLPTLEKELKNLEPHPQFRLWLTSEAHQDFPAILLESCYKVAFEAPPGIKKNMQTVFKGWQASFFEKGSALRSQQLFSLALFQSLIQERRTYIPQGWSKFYEFSSSDLRAAVQYIDNLKTSDQTILLGIFIQAIYGGRIDNSNDQVVLETYLKKLFSSPNYQNVQIPQNTNSFQNFVQQINKLPDQDTPSLFGLPQNIDKGVQRQILNQLLDKIRTIENQNQAHDDSRLLGIIDHWSSGESIKLLKTSSQDSLENFVIGQIKLGQELNLKIKESFDRIASVLKGNGLMTTLIQQEMTALNNGSVPKGWQNLWEGPANITIWLKTFAHKNQALQAWQKYLTNDSLMNEPLDLSELFYSEIFLNALRQKASRKLKIPIDELKLAISFDPSKLHSELTIKIKGLALQGAGFDLQTQKLIDPVNNAPEYTMLPPAYIAWIQTIDQDPHPESQCINVPLYSEGNREKMISHLKFMNMGKASERVLSGVAVFLDTEEY